MLTQPPLSVTPRATTQRLPGGVDELTSNRQEDEVSYDEADQAPTALPSGFSSLGSVMETMGLTLATPSASAMS